MERNRAIYDRLCVIADRLLARYNPCAGCQGCDLIKPQPYDCCEGCPFLGPQGCTTSCLACKLWLCAEPENKANLDARKTRLIHQMWRLKRIAIKLNLHYARALPEEVLALAPDDRHGIWHFYYSMKRAPEFRIPVKFIKDGE